MHMGVVVRNIGDLIGLRTRYARGGAGRTRYCGATRAINHRGEVFEG
jgi:hypothetical protein